MKRALIGVLFGLLAVPIAWAGASNPCATGLPASSSTYCSFSSSTLALPTGNPNFAMNRQGWPSALLGTRMLNFMATFHGNHFGTANSGGAVSFVLPEQAGRLWGGEGAGGGAGIGPGFFSNGAPDGWYRRPPIDSWFRFPVTWNPNFTGFNTGDPGTSPLGETPEPLTLALFGTGLLLIALISRRRLSVAGGSR